MQRCLFMMVFPFLQDALCTEINNLGINYGKELLEKPPVASNEQKNHSSHTSVDLEQFLRWEKLLHLTSEMSSVILYSKKRN